MKYRTAAITDIGNQRTENEDSLLLCRRNFGKEEALLAAVADGMGGLCYGDMASKLAIESLRQWWEETVMSMEKEPEISRVADMLGFAIEGSHARIRQEMGRLQTNMGTTLSMVFLWRGEYVIHQVGDSRVYLMDGKKLSQLTVDQTWCQEEVDAGRMDGQEAKTHQLRHVLSNALGSNENFYIKTQLGRIKHRQCLLLCSDGYYNYLDAKELRHRAWPSSPQKCLEKSRERIQKGAAEDNFTAIMIEA